MGKSSLTALYFVLTFLAGAAVGSWALWIYLIGVPSGQTLAPTVEQAPAPSPIVEKPDAAPQPAAASEVEDEPREPAAAPSTSLPATPTPKGHWETVDTPPRTHEECLALTKELNDAYKDCRFGVHKEVWVPD